MDYRAIDLFAGVGGFHLAAQRSGWKVVWANQWEPGKKVQHAYDCYVKNFPDTFCVNEDIAKVLDDELEIPEHDIVLGGFPCQDYSVATTGAKGIRGQKGVLWWQIARLVKRMGAPYLLLENVDRLLKSPTTQRGRDFAIMLATLDNLGYSVEWRVINAAEYGFPQRRRRVFIFAWHNSSDWDPSFKKETDWKKWLERNGLFANAFPAKLKDTSKLHINEKQTGLFEFGFDEPMDNGVIGDNDLDSPDNDSRLLAISRKWKSHKVSPFKKAGIMVDGTVLTSAYQPNYDGPIRTLGDILQRESVDKQFSVEENRLEEWKYLKGAKAEERVVKSSGFTYLYKEGALSFPDRLDKPARTILTAEGGNTPSRFKHIIQMDGGRYRRLTPIEVERLNGFDDGWTDTGMPLNMRYFCMGNALVVGVVERLLYTIKEVIEKA